MPTRAAARFFSTFYQWSSECSSRAQLRSLTRHNGQCIERRIKSPAIARSFSSTSQPRDQSSQQIPSKADLHRSPDINNVNIHPDLSSHLRLLMRRVPHSVVVITSSSQAETQSPHDSSQTPQEAAFRGMTCSSFNTVSLSPPLVSFNIRLPSASYDALKASGIFLVHLLNSNPAGARICDTFAKGNEGGNKAFERLVRSEQDMKIFSGKGSGGAPLLAGDGIMRVLRCRVRDEEVRIGDHVVIIGEVLGVVNASAKARRAEAEGEMGLVYADRAYHELGKPIDLRAEESQESATPEIQRTMGLGVRRGDESLS